MSTSQVPLSSELHQFASELRRIEQRLKSERPPDPATLTEFRHSVDNVRLTAWGVSELINAEHIKKNPDTVLAFLSAERLRRFDQLVKNLCGDIERGLITVQTNGLQSLCDSLNHLQQRIAQLAKHRIHAFKAKDAGS